MSADVHGRSTGAGVEPVTRFGIFAVGWLTAYALIHLWWAVGGAPRFLMGRESYFPGGWVPVVIATVALLGCAAVRPGTRHGLPEGRHGLRDGGHHALAGLNAVAGVALCAYSFLFPVIIVSILFEGGTTEKAVSLLATGSGAAGGIFCLVIAARERRLAVRPCGACGRVHGRSPERRDERSPGWAYAGAYLAIGSFLARMSVWMHDLLAGEWPSEASRANGFSWTGMTVFLALMSLAGTMLPLALVHRWGRLWPAWLGPLHGRAVPRWLVLGVGLFIGASLTAYFGIAGMTAWIRGDFGGPFLPLLLQMGGYTLWGVGLLVASVSYFRLTRPPCSLSTVNAGPGRDDSTERLGR